MAAKVGVLLPVFSVPSRKKQITFGDDLRKFIDFLASAEQDYWQILPLGHTDESNSPYKCYSAFAIDPKYLDGNIDMKLLKSAGYKKWLRQNAFWLDGYVDYVGGGDGARLRQFLLQKEWLEIKNYANGKGIKIIGDLPFYLSEESADFISRPELFDAGSIAGVPPDNFKKDGQKWDMPVYDWAEHKRTGYEWWLSRIEQALALFDVVRLDHFRGFYNYYSYKGKNGKWRMGPGMDFVRAVRRKLPDAAIIVENLGRLSKEAKAFVKKSGFPKMSVVQYSFYKKDNPRLSHMDSSNFVAYTGTHDADTLVGWIKKPANLNYVENAKRELGVRTKKELPDAMIREVLDAPSIFSIVQLQDYIGLGNAYRVNMPGTISKRNWSTKLKASMLTKGLARKMREMKSLCARVQNGKFK